MSCIKVLSYNVASTFGMDGKPDFRRSAEVIKNYDPDVAGIQELGVFTKRAPEVNAPLEIAKYTRMNYIFSCSLVTTEAGGQYGPGAFSTYTMTAVERIFLPTPEGAEPRTVLIVKVNAPEPFYFAVCHFSFQSEYDKSELYRTIGAKLITDTVVYKKYFPCIWVGDFNCFKGSDTIDYISKYWLIANELDPDTPTAECGILGERQIDFICAYPPERFKVKSFRVLPDRTASDHNPVAAELELLSE